VKFLKSPGLFEKKPFFKKTQWAGFFLKKTGFFFKKPGFFKTLQITHGR